MLPIIFIIISSICTDRWMRDRMDRWINRWTGAWMEAGREGRRERGRDRKRESEGGITPMNA